MESLWGTDYKRTQDGEWPRYGEWPWPTVECLLGTDYVQEQRMSLDLVWGMALAGLGDFHIF